MMLADLIERKGAQFSEELHLVDQLVRNAHPAIVATIKYGLPFFVMKKNLFYLDIQKGRPLLGVVYGVHITEISELLDFTKRTQIGHYFLDKLEEENYAELVAIIDASIAFDLAK